jgi:hypothetical protein
MSWEVKIVLYKESTLARISGTWTDPIPELGVFTYSTNARVDVASADAFIVRAIARRDAWQIYQAENNTKSAWTLGRLNTADPKVA